MWGVSPTTAQGISWTPPLAEVCFQSSQWGVSEPETLVQWNVRLCTCGLQTWKITLVHCKVTGELLCDGSQFVSLHLYKNIKSPRYTGVTQSCDIREIMSELCNDDQDMMTSSNGNIFRVTGHLSGEFTGPRWIPGTKASDAELWCFLWSAPE